MTEREGEWTVSGNEMINSLAADRINTEIGKERGEKKGMGVVIIRFFAAALFILGVFAVFAVLRRKDGEPGRKEEKAGEHGRERGRRDSGKIIQERQEENRQREKDGQREKERLTEEYCRLIEKIEEKKGEEQYRDIFLRYGSVYQNLLGLTRRMRQGDISREEFLNETGIVFENSRITGQLSENGFSVRKEQETVDLEEYRRLCLSKDTETLSAAVEQQRRMLAHYSGFMNFKELIRTTGPALYEVSRRQKEGAAEGCAERIAFIREELKKNGCFPIFADDSRVAAEEGLRVCFLDDSPEATELPGLFARGRSGKYELIGTCCGTRRKHDEQNG